MFHYPINFLSEIPSYDLILETLRKNTGLDISGDPLERYFCCPLLHNEKLGLTREGNKILIWRTDPYESYLFYATVATLITLGGKSTQESVDQIPEWAWKKWGEFTPMPPESYTNRSITIPFKNTQPSPEMVLQKVRDNTGLDLSLLVEPVAYRILHSILDFNEVMLLSNFSINDDREKRIYLGTEKELSSNYVIESILAALIDLGGEYNKVLPPQAWQPWEQAKSYYLS